MKKLILLAALTALFLTPGYGQTNRGESEVGVCAGVLSSNQLFEVFKDLAIDITSLGYAPTRGNEQWSGPYFLTYRYYVTNRFGVNGTIGTDNVTGDLLHSGNAVGRFTVKNVTFAVEASLNYLNTKYVRLYGYWGMGATFVKETNEYYSNSSDNYIHNWNHINIQFAPLGVRVGGRFGGHLEVGFGYKGVINCGLSYVFSSHTASKQPQDNP